MLECKFFVNTSDTIDANLRAYCENIANIKQISHTGKSVSVMNTALVDNLLDRWNAEMSGITPYYAVKALPDEKIIDKMTYFDCASAAEFKGVIARGKNPENIIYANTAKRPMDIVEAKNYGIKVMTADSIHEVEKILRLYPECGIVLRVAPSDSGAQFTKFAHKFGSVTSENSKRIIDRCPKNIRGFSFHVGCGQTNINAWSDAMMLVEELFEYIKSNHPDCYETANIIDIGGGYCSDVTALHLTDIRASLNDWMIRYSDKRWIAEPGRFFCADVMTLLCPIISKNLRDDDRQYYVIGNSIHHTFSCIIFDLHKPRQLTAEDWPPNTTLCDGTVVGETCDGVDVLYHGILPYDLDIGTVLIFQGIGAYSNASANHFNGFTPPETVYYS
jgi:ornithine decarboxylase